MTNKSYREGGTNTKMNLSLDNRREMIPEVPLASLIIFL